MKRYLLGTLAVIVALAGFAFTKPTQSKKNTQEFFLQYNSGSVTSLGSYSQLVDIPAGATAEEQYDALCHGSEAICAMRTDTDSPVLSDINSDNIPDLTGGVEETKEKQ